MTFLPYDLARLSGEPGLFLLLTLVAAHGEWAHYMRHGGTQFTCFQEASGHSLSRKVRFAVVIVSKADIDFCGAYVGL